MKNLILLTSLLSLVGCASVHEIREAEQMCRDGWEATAPTHNVPVYTSVPGAGALQCNSSSSASSSSVNCFRHHDVYKSGNSTEAVPRGIHSKKYCEEEALKAIMKRNGK